MNSRSCTNGIFTYVSLSHNTAETISLCSMKEELHVTIWKVQEGLDETSGDGLMTLPISYFCGGMSAANRPDFQSS